MKRLAVIIGIFGLCCVAGTIALFLHSTKSSRPPNESTLIKAFQEHRADFDRLRDMLQEDSQLRVVAPWGVVTTNSPVSKIPPEGDFPVARYKEYMRLLDRVSADGASRSEGKHADPRIWVWGWGFAWNSRQVSICWMEQAPTNLIPTLDNYAGTHRYPHKQIAYRHIDSKWYFWTTL